MSEPLESIVWQASDAVRDRLDAASFGIMNLTCSYLRSECKELKKHFLVQPGLVDGFVINSDHPPYMRPMPLGTRVRLAAREILPSAVYGFLAKVYNSMKG
jgi:hypothetical protein